MANPEHLGILQQGVEVWNAWRDQHEDMRPDLGRADLHRAELWGANLYGTNLNRADLTNADLTNADLREADVFMANLRGTNLHRTNLRGADFFMAILTQANLTQANLFMANLVRADLREADLREADLFMANLSGANLGAANLSHVAFSETVFGYTNLTAAQGLETCRHGGPSILDHRTLVRSGPLPPAFLRGCGLPDALINYLSSLLNEPFQFYSCFISYSSADEAFCRRLHERLQNAGLRVWFAPHDIQGGRKLHEQIDQAIRAYDKLLLVLSPHSMQSPWVEFEIRRARRREVAEQRRLLFPVRLVDYEAIKAWECFDTDTAEDLGTEIRKYYIPDFTSWKEHDAFEAAVDRLLRDLKAESGQPHG